MNSDSTVFQTTTDNVSDEVIKRVGASLEESAKDLEEKYAYVDQLIEDIVDGSMPPAAASVEFQQAALKELMAINYNLDILRTLIGLNVGLEIFAKKPEECDKD